jgi:hypothetical protein
MSMDLSFGSSCERDLTLSKLWLCAHLPRTQWGKVYVLGSWYGNVGLVMRMLGMHVDHLVNIDSNPEFCRKSRTLYELAGYDLSYEVRCGDCNQITYDDADLVINTSTNDIPGLGWLERIPRGTVVALQCRNNQNIAGSKMRPSSLSDFMGYFHLSEILFNSTLPLHNHQESYERYMVIGYR